MVVGGKEGGSRFAGLKRRGDEGGLRRAEGSAAESLPSSPQGEKRLSFGHCDKSRTGRSQGRIPREYGSDVESQRETEAGREQRRMDPATREGSEAERG